MLQIPVRRRNALPSASDEQQLIINDVVAGSDVCVDAVAGSGKTTTIMLLAQALPDHRLLVITYNKKLNIESRNRAELLGLKNIDIHTYHSACGTYFALDDGKNSFENTIRTVGNNVADQRQPIPHDILIVDEVQDMNKNRYDVIKRFLRCMERTDPQIVLLGDVYQCIYNFGSSPADPRFLTMAFQLFGREFKSRTLSVSHRITHQMATFNNHMIGRQRIKATKSGDKVVYITGNPFKIHEEVYRCLMKYLTFDLKQSYKPDEIMVLAHSVKKNSIEKPVHKLENLLVASGIPIYRPLDDDTELVSAELFGKLVISSFHQSKGLERKIVICYGFDNMYFKYSGKEQAILDGHIDPYRCPNEWYVATTRALEKLIVVSGHRSPPWMQTEPPQSCVNIYGKFVTGKCSPQKKNTLPKLQVTNFIKFKTSGQVFFQMESLYEPLLSYHHKGSNIPVIHTITGSTVENVSDISALAISLMYEDQIKSADPELKPISTYLKKATLLEADSSGYNNRLRQIESYDWMTMSQRDSLLSNYKLHLGDDPNIQLEQTVSRRFDTSFGEVTVNGRVDAISNGCVWEFKMTTELKPEHILQLIVYSAIIGNDTLDYRLLNIETGECIQLRPDKKSINSIMNLLFETHYGIKKIDDTDFLTSCTKQTCVDCDDDYDDENYELEERLI